MSEMLPLNFIINKISEGAFSQALHALRKKRLEAARDILIAAIRIGEKDIYDAAQVDEFVAIVDRYMRAAQEGTARLNLQLLAKIVAGQKEMGAFIASDFLHYADVLSSLEREEIIFLGCMYKHSQFMVIDPAKNFKANPEKAASLAFAKMGELLIPSVFSNPIDMAATASAITRSGLLLSVPAIGGTYGYRITPFLEKLCELASFEDVIGKEYSANPTKVA